MAAVIFSGDRLKALVPALQFGNQATIFSGPDDPSSIATAGEVGDVYLSTGTGIIYTKQDSGITTNWTSTGVVPKYSQTFIGADWAGPSSGNYSITIAAATHLKGTEPLVTVFEKSGSDYEVIIVNTIINSFGSVTIYVNQTPDLRFIGKIIIS